MGAWYGGGHGGPEARVHRGHGLGHLPLPDRRRGDPALRRVRLAAGHRHPDDRADPDDRRRGRDGHLVLHDDPVGSRPPPRRLRRPPPAGLRAAPRPARPVRLSLLRSRSRLRSAAVTAVRDARDDQAGAVDDLLSRAGFGPSVGRLIAFPRTSPHGDVLVAEDDGRLLGGVCCASFGATGWIGALGVAPEARRQGLGTALTEAACARLHERGAQTVLLFATDLGRPVYERLGFEAEGNATAWRGSAGTARAGVSLRRLREADRPAVLRLDREATGQRREAVLDAISPLGRPLVQPA